MSKEVKQKESSYLGRSLDNYKKLHSETANSKGVYKDFMSATTLTKAKKILFGLKRGNIK